MEERYLSLAEACDVLGKSERTLYRWIKSGKLKAYKPGRDYEIPESAIQEMRERSEVHPKGLEPPLSFSRWLQKRCGHAYLALSEEELIQRFDDLEAVEDAANKKRDLFTAVQAEYLATIKTRHLPTEERVLVRGHHREAGGKWLLAQMLSGQAEGITEAFEQSIKEAIEAAMGETA
jgi:excisionase family DNA binding protein